MLARLCQLKNLELKSLSLLALVTMSGCSLFSGDDDLVKQPMDKIRNYWFSKNPEHSLWDRELKPVPHHFFDVNPDLSDNDVLINAVVMTPEGSPHAYQLDLLSGQRLYSHSYCPQKDIWSQYSGKIHKPTFSIGVIPRLLDQMGEPQKIIIFGGEEEFNKRIDYYDHHVRLVGAFIEQTCPEGNCLGKSNWISRMVFIAVDPKDKKYAKVSDLPDLQKEIDWAEERAVYENMDGRNGGSGTSFPMIRLGNLIKLTEAMDYYKKRSIYLDDAQTEKIRTGCQALYNKAWTDVGIERPEDKHANTVEELNAKVKLQDELKKKRLPVGFAARLKAFTEKYYTEYATCQKFIYAGNINKDLDKFWFLSYLGIYYRLHKDGYYFDCNGKSWQSNVLNSSGKAIFNVKTDIADCKDRDFDLAMEYLPNFLISLRSGFGSYYKFVDYDTSALGTHHKLYSWVKMKSRKYDCQNDPNIDIKKEIKVFPDDVSWKTRDVKDIADKLKIIY